MMPVALLKFASATESKIAKKLGDWVVQRWARYRAEQFIEAFVESLRSEYRYDNEMTYVDVRLDAILGDETKSEVLFYAYRRVCFTKSKTLGPRIIGTSLLVSSARISSRRSS